MRVVVLDGFTTDQGEPEVFWGGLRAVGEVVASQGKGKPERLTKDGAAPQFGRNALGGALVLRSKSGKTDPGVSVEASAGSFGRVTGSLAAGGVTGNGLDWFVTADHFREDGWRDLSPSRATRALAKLGWMS